MRSKEYIGRERENPYNSYVPLLCDIIDRESSIYEEAAEKKEWKDVMIEEYQSIMKNDVYDIVLRPEKKSVVFKVDLQEKACCIWKHR